MKEKKKLISKKNFFYQNTKLVDLKVIKSKNISNKSIASFFVEISVVGNKGGMMLELLLFGYDVIDGMLAGTLFEVTTSIGGGGIFGSNRYSYVFDI